MNQPTANNRHIKTRSPMERLLRRSQREQHRQNDRRQHIGIHRGDARQLRRVVERHHRGDHVGDRQRPCHQQSQMQMLVQHRRSRLQSEQDEKTKKDRHLAAARDAKGHRRHEDTGVDGIVRAFRRDHASDVAGAESLDGRLSRFGAPARRRANVRPNRRRQASCRQTDRSARRAILKTCGERSRECPRRAGY